MEVTPDPYAVTCPWCDNTYLSRSRRRAQWRAAAHEIWVHHTTSVIRGSGVYRPRCGTQYVDGTGRDRRCRRLHFHHGDHG